MSANDIITELRIPKNSTPPSFPARKDGYKGIFSTGVCCSLLRKPTLTANTIPASKPPHTASVVTNMIAQVLNDRRLP